MTVHIENQGIEFYQFDPDTMVPILETCVGNIFNCTHVLF